MTRRTETRYVVWHCSASRPGADIGVRQIREWHISPPRNWSDIGYHLVIRRDGMIEAGRPLEEIGAHVAGHNSDSVGVCLVGGLDEQGASFGNRPDLFTPAQWASVRIVYELLRRMYPHAQHLGHRDLSPDTNGDGKITPGEWLKTCPGFDVLQEIVKL
jgi:N-acetyl-anhydromuramyl-L-alanine amidase AmpD